MTADSLPSTPSSVDAGSVRGLDFAAVVWGREHIERFCRLTVGSLLGRGNIPSLPAMVLSDTRVLIATKREDAVHFEAAEGFREIRRMVAVEMFYFRPDHVGQHKMAAMSAGHRRILAHVLRKRRACVFLTADMIFAEGSVQQLYTWLSAGKALVLAPALRFDESPVTAGLAHDSLALSVPARELARCAIAAPHSETRTFDWRSEAFAHNPVAFLARSKDQGLMAVHSLSWAPVLMDYSAIRRHDGRSLKHWTMDGDYVSRNFEHLPDVRKSVVLDSDAFLMISLTSESELSLPENPQTVFRLFPGLATRVRRRRIAQFALSPSIDPMKRRLFCRTAIFRARDPLPTDGSLISALAGEVARALDEPDRPLGTTRSLALGALELLCNGGFWTYWAFRVWGVIWRSPYARLIWISRNRRFFFGRLRDKIFPW